MVGRVLCVRLERMRMWRGRGEAMGSRESCAAARADVAVVCKVRLCANRTQKFFFPENRSMLNKVATRAHGRRRAGRAVALVSDHKPGR